MFRFVINICSIIINLVWQYSKIKTHLYSLQIGAININKYLDVILFSLQIRLAKYGPNLLWWQLKKNITPRELPYDAEDEQYCL